MHGFEEAVRFHGHACPGLAFGFRAAEIALAELGLGPARDEELVAVCENRSCAVDAIQVLTGCTAGKGNLIFRDYGKQVYTFIKRQNGASVRLAVCWEASPESLEQQRAWQEFSAGHRSPEVMGLVRGRKAEKIKGIRAAAPEELFRISHLVCVVPEAARVYASVRCQACGEKVMEPMAQRRGGRLLCIPCLEAQEASTP
ncbi:FmdE family protein [Thiovibrio frasassiensis]|uniref:FmdE family protein n=1 Tax=Thiovibrio frasassiensis TaxID=2984131 RepID=A0A9X4MGU9_9BACT|nr:FmdE family protein [Thiovibrio frasassiensis]MDG4475273.1 FmdE family protein [Thiovibrio frasassiensis]